MHILEFLRYSYVLRSIKFFFLIICWIYILDFFLLYIQGSLYQDFTVTTDKQYNQLA